LFWERWRMTWIKTVRMDDDERVKKAMEAQRKLYPIEYATPVHAVNDGETAGIVASHTLMPEALYHSFSAFGAMMSPELPLKRHQHEMIATMVSITNRCFYWIESHAEFLRRVTLKPEMVDALQRDYKTAPISEQDKAICEYVVKLTKDATQCSREDHEKLRAAGFDDQGILQITLIASWFNYINRVADALGVGREWIAEK
jgi:uncharacterized peroxidase-related enzyme